MQVFNQASGGRWWLSGVIWVVLALPAQAQIQRISVDSDGVQANLGSHEASISADGSVVAFRSNASNLVADDTNGTSDIFVNDLSAGVVERVSLDEDGSELGNGQYNNSARTSISDDGNRIAFQNYSLSGFPYVLVRDRAAASTTIVLPIVGGEGDKEARQEPALSGSGQFVAFHSMLNFQSSLPVSARPIDDDNNGSHDIFVYDLDTQPTPPTERVSRDSNGVEGHGGSYSASLSNDGRWVAFYSVVDSFASDDNNLARDVFVKDRQTGAIERVSVSSAGLEGDDESQQAMISGDGQHVVFRSRASNLVAGDDNRQWDIFVRDRSAGTTERVSVSSQGEQANHGSFSPGISDDGRYVVFRSNASNLVPDDSNQRFDIFVHDRSSGAIARVSTSASGEQANGHSYRPAISGDGNWIVFESDATNLVAGDTNRARDIFRVANPL